MEISQQVFRHSCHKQVDRDHKFTWVMEVNNLVEIIQVLDFNY